MCGRLAVTLPADAMAQMFEAVPSNDLPHVPNYNICPTDPLHVVTSQGQRRLVAMRWGFVPHWYKAPNDGPLLINARSETIATKPAFADACRHRRCIVPVTGYYEWTKDAQGARLPWYMSATAPLALAAVWQPWGDGVSCAILTCAANESMGQVHHRMPVLLSPEDWGTWLGETKAKAAPLMRPAPEGALSAHRVRPAVNSNRAAGPELIEPL